MRCTHDMGFGTHNPINQEELVFLECRKYAKSGMFDEFPMYEYVNASGEVVYQEFIQFCPWSSGPMECHAYKRMSDGQLFSYWTQEEVDVLG